MLSTSLVNCVLIVHEWRRNRVANEMDAAKKSSDFFSDGVIENLFSNIQAGVKRECKRQEVPPSCNIESE